MGFFNRQGNKIQKFEKLTENVSAREKRDIEEHLLKPEDIPLYIGPMPKHKSDLSARTTLIVFRDKKQQELIGRLFSIRESCTGESYITDIQLLENIAKGVEDGTYGVRDNCIEVFDPNTVPLELAEPVEITEPVETTDVNNDDGDDAQYVPGPLLKKAFNKRERRPLGTISKRVSSAEKVNSNVPKKRMNVFAKKNIEE